MSTNVEKPKKSLLTGKKEKASDKKPKKVKEPKQKKTAKNRKSSKLLSIRNKIVVCFLVPIVFMVIIGVSAYQKSAEGLSEKFTDSTLQTMRMVTEYLDMSCDFIRSEGLKYAYDDDLRKYFLGMFEENPVDKLNFLTSTKSNLLSVQTSNPFISHMHIIPQKGVSLLSTKLSSGVDGFLDEYKEDPWCALRRYLLPRKVSQCYSGVQRQYPSSVLQWTMPPTENVRNNTGADYNRAVYFLLNNPYNNYAIVYIFLT